MKVPPFELRSISIGNDLFVESYSQIRGPLKPALAWLTEDAFRPLKLQWHVSQSALICISASSWRFPYMPRCCLAGRLQKRKKKKNRTGKATHSYLRCNYLLYSRLESDAAACCCHLDSSVRWNVNVNLQKFKQTIATEFSAFQFFLGNGISLL